MWARPPAGLGDVTFRLLCPTACEAPHCTPGAGAAAAIPLLPTREHRRLVWLLRLAHDGRRVRREGLRAAATAIEDAALAAGAPPSRATSVVTSSQWTHLVLAIAPAAAALLDPPHAGAGAAQGSAGEDVERSSMSALLRALGRWAPDGAGGGAASANRRAPEAAGRIGRIALDYAADDHSSSY